MKIKSNKKRTKIIIRVNLSNLSKKTEITPYNYIKKI
jgi:ribosomal protein S20